LIHSASCTYVFNLPHHFESSVCLFSVSILAQRWPLRRGLRAAEDGSCLRGGRHGCQPYQNDGPQRPRRHLRLGHATPVQSVRRSPMCLCILIDAAYMMHALDTSCWYCALIGRAVRAASRTGLRRRWTWRWTTSSTTTSSRSRRA
jgi:hypothetical protein